MNRAKMVSGVAVAAAMALAMTPAATADTVPGGGAGTAGSVWQINPPELTAAETGGITTVTFAPDSVGDDVHCMGPRVSDMTVAKEAGETGIPDSIPGQIDWSVGNSDIFAIPKGFAEANQTLIDEYVDTVYHEGVGPSREDLAQFAAGAMLSPLLGVGETLGAGSGNDFANAVPSSYMDRTAERNEFGYELNPDHQYMAMANCVTGDLGNADSLTDPKVYMTYINGPAFDFGDANEVTVFTPGASVLVQFTGLPPGAAYTLAGRSTPFCTLDDAHADADGALTFLCTLPEDLAPGMHHFTVEDGSGEVASIEFKVSGDGAAQGVLKTDAGGTDNGTDNRGDNGGGAAGASGSLGSLSAS